MSDANYKKVELKGPSIDQVVHPLAGADFAGGRAVTGTNKKIISSCEGSLVSVDVDLRVSDLCVGEVVTLMSCCILC
jgi:nucleoporin POM152